jgi:hypothetical protein
MWLLFALPALLIPILTSAGSLVWPDLPQTCFVKGRPASEEDARKGCAVFVIKQQGQLAGTPLNIEIPQYAIHVEDGTGKETPVVVIQAEENAGIQAVGYKEVGTSAVGAALLRELHLLGTKKPK